MIEYPSSNLIYFSVLYSRNFISLLCRIETPESVMEVYRHIVPSIYTPEQSAFEV